MITLLMVFCSLQGASNEDNVVGVFFVYCNGLVIMITLLMIFCLLQRASNQDHVVDVILFIARG